MEAILPLSYESSPHRLHIGRVAVPQLSVGEVLVKVKATALNRLDVLQRLGKYPVPAGSTTILGVECAGIVVQVGDSSTER